MIFRLNITELAGGKEVTLEVTRPERMPRVNILDKLRWASEERYTYKAALVAIRATPDAAVEIVNAMLTEEDDV